MKHFLTIDEVAKILGKSRSTASRRIAAMNKEMKEQGYYVEQGIVPVGKFLEKYPYINLEEGEHQHNDV